LGIAAFGGRFVTMGKASHIILVSTIRGLRRKSVVHEFFHYLHWCNEDFPEKGAPNEEWEREEKITRSETNAWLKKNKIPRKPRLGNIRVIKISSEEMEKLKNKTLKNVRKLLELDEERKRLVSARAVGKMALAVLWN
jgi:hypothetical protein